MKNPDSKKLGHWLAYLWTSLVNEVEQCGLKHHPATLLPSKEPFLAYKLPAHNPAMFGLPETKESILAYELIQSEISALNEFPGYMSDESDYWEHEADLLERPFIYN